MDRERMALRDKAVNYRSASGRPPGWPRSLEEPLSSAGLAGGPGHQQRQAASQMESFVGIPRTAGTDPRPIL